MDSLSGNQVKDLKDLYKSIYKVEESTEEAAPSSVEEETIMEMPTLPKMGTLFPSEIKKDDNKINFSTNIAGTSINKNQIDKNKNKKISNIPPEEGSNKKFNPDFGKKPEVNKVDSSSENQNNIVKKGPDLNAISKYTDSNRKEVTMKDFQSSDSGVKPEIKPVKSKMNPIEVKNRARFGDDRVDMLKAKNIDFKAMRKGDMTKDAFIKKYPKSITAQKASNLRDQYEPYDVVLDYVLSEGHADTVEEAHYVMMQMDEDTIKTIIKENPILKTALVGLGGYMGYKGLKKAGDSFNNMLNNLRNNSKLGGNKRVDDVRKNSGDPNVGQKINFGAQGNKP